MLEFDSSLLIFGSVAIAMIVVIFFITSNTLNNYCHDIDKHYSIIAWIPILRLYLLGKYTVHKFFGFVLMIGVVLSGKLVLTIDGVTKVYSFFPDNTRLIILYTTLATEAFLFTLLFVMHVKSIQKYINGMNVQTDNYVNNSVSRSLRKTPEIEDFRIVQARIDKEKTEKEKKFVESNHIPSDEDLNKKNQTKNNKDYNLKKIKSQQDYIDNFKI